MPLTLGEAFAPRPVVEDETVREVSVDSLRSEMLLAALERLHEALAQMPAPVVHVSEPDLSAVVNAVQGIKGPATPEEIAAALRQELAGGEQPQIEPTLKKLTEALERLDFRLKGIGTTSGGGGVGSYVKNSEGTSLDTQLAQTDTRYEWQVAGESSVPLYVGTAKPGTATATGEWRIDKYTYDLGPAGDSVPVAVQSATGAWDSRASLFA